MREAVYEKCYLCCGAIHTYEQMTLTKDQFRVHADRDECIRTLRSDAEYGTSAMSWIEYLLHDAYYHDDKRHRLFYTIKKIARLYEKRTSRLLEIERLMDAEIDNINTRRQT